MKKQLTKRLGAFVSIVLVLLFSLAGAISPVQAASITYDADGWPVAPDLVSGNAILVDADTGAILYEKNAYEKSYPASTTKILTGLLACENDTLTDTLTFSKSAATSVSFGDATLSFKTGEQVSVKDALYGLLLYSANELAYALAEYTAGSLDAFVQLMNDRAAQVGAVNTHFANASGLYDPDHYTTAYDMSLIARECFKNPTFMSIDATEYYEIGPTNMTDTTRKFNNRNKLLPGLSHGYEYCVGGKTGYTEEGGDTYVGEAEKDGMRLIVVLFRSGEDTRFDDAQSLFEWGFSAFSHYALTDVPAAASFTSQSFLTDSHTAISPYTFTFNTSYITAPVKTDLSTISMTAGTVENASGTTGSSSSGTATSPGKASGTSTSTTAAASGTSASSVASPVTFTIGSHLVGASSLLLSLGSYGGLVLPDDLPVSETAGTTGGTRHSLVISLWIPVILLLIYLIHKWREAARAHAERRKKVISMQQRRREQYRRDRS